MRLPVSAPAAAMSPPANRKSPMTAKAPPLKGRRMYHQVQLLTNCRFPAKATKDDTARTKLPNAPMIMTNAMMSTVGSPKPAPDVSLDKYTLAAAESHCLVTVTNTFCGRSIIDGASSVPLLSTLPADGVTDQTGSESHPE